MTITTKALKKNKHIEAMNRFRHGMKMAPEQLKLIPLVERCRYVVSKFFEGKSFNAKEVHDKLNEVCPNELITVLDVADSLKAYFGNPGETKPVAKKTKVKVKKKTTKKKAKKK